MDGHPITTLILMRVVKAGVQWHKARNQLVKLTEQPMTAYRLEEFDMLRDHTSASFVPLLLPPPALELWKDVPDGSSREFKWLGPLKDCEDAPARKSMAKKMWKSHFGDRLDSL